MKHFSLRILFTFLIAGSFFSVKAQCDYLEVLDLKGVPGFSQLDLLNVCGDADTLGVLVYTLAPDLIKSVQITAHLPGGIEYAGFVDVAFGGTSAMLIDGSDPSNPKILLSDIDASSSVALYIGVQAGCDAMITSPLTISYSISYIDPNFQKCKQTFNMPGDLDNTIKQASLNVLNATPNPITLDSIGQVLTRTICVQQDGLGAYIDSFHFTIDNIDLTSGVSMPEIRVGGVSTPFIYDPVAQSVDVLISGSLFLNTANSNPTDERFNVNEQICIEVDYRFDECPSNSSMLPEYSAEWGCGGEICAQANIVPRGLNIFPDFDVDPLATMELTQQPSICGQEAIFEFVVQSDVIDPATGVIHDLEMEFDFCNAGRFTTTALEIGGTVIPAAAWTHTGTTLILDLTQLTVDPDGAGIGLEDLNGVGGFNDLVGSDSLVGQIKATFACDAVNCAVLNCSIDRLTFRGKRNCGIPWQQNVDFDPINLVMGADSTWTNEDDSDADNTIEVNVGPVPNTGVEYPFTIVHGYSMNQVNVLGCTNYRSYMDLLISGPAAVIDDLEFVPGSATWCGVPVSDSKVTFVKDTVTNTISMQIDTGDANINVACEYTYQLQANECLAPTKYITIDSRVVQECLDMGCNCEFTKSCDPILVEIDYSGCTQCWFRTDWSMKRANYGYSDASMTTQLTSADVANGLDLVRWMPYDTVQFDYTGEVLRDGLQFDSLGIWWFHRRSANNFNNWSNGRLELEVILNSMVVHFKDATTGIKSLVPCGSALWQHSDFYNNWGRDQRFDEHDFQVNFSHCLDLMPTSWDDGDSLFVTFKVAMNPNHNRPNDYCNRTEESRISSRFVGQVNGDLAPANRGSSGIFCNTPTSTYFARCPEVEVWTDIQRNTCDLEVKHNVRVSNMGDWYGDEYRPVYDVVDIEVPVWNSTFIDESSENICYTSEEGTADYDSPQDFDSSLNLDCTISGGNNYCFSQNGNDGRLTYNTFGEHPIGAAYDADTLGLCYTLGKVCPSQDVYTGYETTFRLRNLLCDDTITIVSTQVEDVDNTGLIPPITTSVSRPSIAATGGCDLNTYTVCAGAGSDDLENVTTFINLPSNVVLCEVKDDLGANVSVTFANGSVNDTTWMISMANMAPNTCVDLDVYTKLLFCPADRTMLPTISIETLTGCVPSSVLLDLGADGPLGDACVGSASAYVYETEESGIDIEVVDQPSGPVDLCTEVTYSMRLKNTKLTTNVNQEFFAYLPLSGMTIVPGSWMVSYPNGPTVQSAFVPITGPEPNVDPSCSGGNGLCYSLDMSEVHAFLGMNGLPGAGGNAFMTDSNQIVLQFKVITNCDTFTSGTPIGFDVDGYGPCGELTPAIGRRTTPLIINGANPVDYPQYLIGAKPVVLNCGASSTMRLSGINLSDATSGLGTTACFTLPPGVVYTPNSVNFLAPATWIPTITELQPVPGVDQVCVTLPAGIATGQQFIVDIDLQIPDTMDCTTLEMGVDVTSWEPAVYCAASMDSCGVKVQNSINPSFQLEIIAPFDMEQLEITQSCGPTADVVTINYSVLLINPGPMATTIPVDFDFYRDLNLNTTLETSLDILLATDPQVVTIATGDSLLVSGSVDIPIVEACPLLLDVVIGASCVCNNITTYLDEIPFDFVEAAGSDVALCGAKTYNVPSCGNITYELNPANGGTVTNVGTDWQFALRPGFGITSPVTMSFTNTLGTCETEGEINFWDADVITLDLGEDEGFCAADCIELDANLAPEYMVGSTVQWTPATDLDDATSFNPFYCGTPGTVTEYIAVVTLSSGCTVTDTIKLKTNVLDTVVMTGDSAICDGNTAEATITAPAGFDLYEWWFMPPTGTPFMVGSSTTPDFTAGYAGDFFVKLYETGARCPKIGNYTLAEIECGCLGDYVGDKCTEMPIPGVLVYLEDASGNIIDSAVTDINGNYLFENLPEGTYTTVMAPSNFAMGGPLEGLYNSVDPDGGNDSEATYNLMVGECERGQNYEFCDPALPIELSYFKAVVDDCTVHLNWATELEVNSAFFEILRSVDGIHWEVIQQLVAAGTSTEHLEYSHIDKDPHATAYYRLRQVDFDGTESFSGIERVRVACAGDVSVALYPNPAPGHMKIRLTGSDREMVGYQIADMFGRTVKEVQQNIEFDLEYGVDVRDLPGGTYTLALIEKSGELVRPVKFVVLTP